MQLLQIFKVLYADMQDNCHFTLSLRAYSLLHASDSQCIKLPKEEMLLCEFYYCIIAETKGYLNVSHALHTSSCSAVVILRCGIGDIYTVF